MPMPPALLAAMERKKKNKGGKSMGKSKLNSNDGEGPADVKKDAKPGMNDDAMPMKTKGSMPPGLAAYMAKHHGKK